MTRRPFLLLGCFLLLVLLFGGGMFGRFLLRAVAPSAEQILTIRSGESLARVAAHLEKQGIVDSARQFTLLARLRGVSDRIQAGDYAFRQAARPGEVLARLVAGDVRRLRVTIPEGWTLAEITLRLEQAGLGPARELRRLAADPSFIASLAVEAASLEGYLFPETYTLVRGLAPQRQLQVMVEQFRSQLKPRLIQTAAQRGLSLHQLVTLASIIQKEAGSVAEMPLISAVFHNRLQRGMLLQSDPTVIYGLSAFDGNLTRRHLETPTPYNTYLNRGLPPGPIASPGLHALRAAAYPAEVPYLYFVAKGDGSHAFSQTLNQHNQAVRRYQLQR